MIKMVVCNFEEKITQVQLKYKTEKFDDIDFNDGNIERELNELLFNGEDDMHNDTGIYNVNKFISTDYIEVKFNINDCLKQEIIEKADVYFEQRFFA